MEDLLYLTHRIPYPPNKGDKIRSYHLLKHLSRRYRVHLGTFVDDPADWQYVEPVKALCGECCVIKLNPGLARIASFQGLLTGEALTLPYYRSPKLQSWVDGILGRFPVRKALVFSSAMTQYLLGKPGLRRVADFVDVDSDKWTQYARTKTWPLSWVYRREGRALLRFERQVAAEFDAALFVSQDEAALFRGLAPETAAKVGHFSNGVDSAYFSPGQTFPNPYGEGEEALVFTGAMDYWPNVDAVEWFAREIFPLVREKSPRTRFYIVGARPSPAVQRLSDLPGVTVTGAVPDVRPYLAHGRIAVAPLRIARGIQNKVLEAMSMGRAVVASPEAAEGIAAVPGVELLIADGAADFAARVSALLDAPPAASALGVAARQRILDTYGWDANLRGVDACLSGMPETDHKAAVLSGDRLAREKS